MDDTRSGSRPAPQYSRRQFLRSAGLGALGLTAAGLLAACGAAAAASDYAMEMTDLNRYDPASLVIPRGATVTWKNTGTVPHTVTDNPALTQNPTHARLPNGVQPWDSGDIYPGDAWSRRFDTPGTYTYFCRHHEGEGMVGTITVTG